jgi:hypothetical protein
MMISKWLTSDTVMNPHMYKLGKNPSSQRKGFIFMLAKTFDTCMLWN